MPVQTTYQLELDAAFEGQIRDLSLRNKFSKTAEGSDIAFGRAVVRGTTDEQALLPSSNEDKYIGVTGTTSAWSETAAGLHLYEQYRTMNIIDYGQIWIYTETAVVPGDDVFYRFIAETAPLDVLGRFRNDDSGGNALKIEGATFETTAAAGELAVIKLTSIETALQGFETLTTAGGASLFTTTTLIDTSGGAFTTTLAAPLYDGQEKILKVTGYTAVTDVTVTNFFDGTTITFSALNDTVTLRAINSDWNLISNIGATIT
jgi:hypothetical protein